MEKSKRWSGKNPASFFCADQPGWKTQIIFIFKNKIIHCVVFKNVNYLQPKMIFKNAWKFL